MITRVNRQLEASLEEKTGQRVRTCYQCRKCSSGCPVAFAMDLMPHEVMKLVQYGKESRVLGSSTIWLCASCETCTTRCPNDIDIAGVMDGLRQMALERGVEPAQPDVVRAHRSFLEGIKLTGKTNEPILIGTYKAVSGNLFDDMGLGLVMFLKRKIKLVPRFVRDREAVRRIFKASRRRP